MVGFHSHSRSWIGSTRCQNPWVMLVWSPEKSA